MSRVFEFLQDLRIDLTARQQFLDAGGEQAGPVFQFGAQALKKPRTPGLSASFVMGP